MSIALPSRNWISILTLLNMKNPYLILLKDRDHPTDAVVYSKATGNPDTDKKYFGAQPFERMKEKRKFLQELELRNAGRQSCGDVPPLHRAHDQASNLADWKRGGCCQLPGQYENIVLKREVEK
ncbi:hypothetical protein BGZ51_004585 [Haplosporangium sp. Z 767]|nr:hypothetical protein BGZ51_004585 [Haplosporangium sp. Z 767]